VARRAFSRQRSLGRLWVGDDGSRRPVVRSSRMAVANEMEIQAKGREARSSQSKRGRNSRKFTALVSLWDFHL
jgi:hypothetical protein